MMKSSKNLIIGASSSGLYTAIRLANKNIESSVFEIREDKARKRTLIITPEIFNLIRIPDELILNKIKYFELYSKNYRIKIELKKPDIVIERSDFLLYLENIAKKSRVKIYRGYRFENLIEDKNKIFAEFSVNGRDKKVYFEFNNLISADGVGSKVLKIINKKFKKIYLYQARVKLPQFHRKDTVKIWFDRSYTDYFVWLIPCNKYEGVLGLCVDEGENVRKSFEKFVKNYNLEVLEPESGVTSHYEPSFIPEYKINGKKIYFVGDAAGQVKMTTVGGTYTGIWGGYCVFKAIEKNKNLKKFYKNLKRELDVHFYMRKVLKRLQTDEFDLILKKAEKKFAFLFYSTTRDNARKLLVKIFRYEPSIFWLGMRKIVKDVNLRNLFFDFFDFLY